MSVVTNLVEFLRARLDEDELAARDAIPDDDRWNSAMVAAWERDPVTATHIARWNPARVLAEVEAKRRIIDYCESAIEAGGIKPGSTWNDDAAGAEVGEAVLHLMALLYAGHPDYDPAWAPVEEETVP